MDRGTGDALHGAADRDVAIEKNGKREQIPSGAIADVVYDLFGDSDGRAEMLRLIGIHMTVTGEFNIVGYTEVDDLGYERDVWHVAAAGKVTRQGSTDDAKYIVNGVTLNVDPAEVIAFRVWRPDPLDPEKAISPARAVLTILGEIHRLTEHVAAQVDSRLAGAGIFLVPSEMQFPAPPPNADGSPRQANNAEDLMVLLQATMAKAIENRGDAEALVPIVITAPADAIASVKHMTFWTELDQHAIELRSEAIRRLALGMDMPPEVLTGTAESNHWNAWQADEAAIKSFRERFRERFPVEPGRCPVYRTISDAQLRGTLVNTLTDEMERQAEALPAARAEADVAGGEQLQVLARLHVVDDELDPGVGLGRPVLEAAMYGKPVVASGSGTGAGILQHELARRGQGGCIQDGKGDALLRRCRGGRDGDRAAWRLGAGRGGDRGGRGGRRDRVPDRHAAVRFLHRARRPHRRTRRRSRHRPRGRRRGGPPRQPGCPRRSG